VSSILTQARSGLWADAVADNHMFSGWARVSPSINFGQVMILNPAASGKQVYIFSVRANMSGTGITMGMGLRTAALATPVTTIGTLTPGSGRLAVSTMSKSTGGSSLITTQYQSHLTLAGEFELLQPHTVVHLTPGGQGWIVGNTSGVFADINVIFVWAELNF